MENLSQQLKPFIRRVRFLRAWRGLAIGSTIGGVITLLWVALDFVGWKYAEWPELALVVSVCGLLGSLAGFLVRVDPVGLTASIDRRANLEDRLSTASESSDPEQLFRDLLHRDASQKLGELRPSRVYPVRLGSWQLAAVALAAVSSAIFLLGNSPVLLSESARRNRAELQKEGAKVERIRKDELMPEDAGKMSESEKKLADELSKLQKDLEKAKITKEQSLRKANEIAQQANEMMRQDMKNSQQDLQTASSALDEMKKDTLQKAGFQNVDPTMAQMSDSERDAATRQALDQRAQLEKSLDGMQKRLAEMQRQLQNKNLSPAERKALEDQKKELDAQLSLVRSQIEANKRTLQSLQLSKEAQAALQKLMNDPRFKDLMLLQQLLQKNAKHLATTGPPPLTKEELEAIRKQLEEFAKKLADPEFVKKYLDALRRAILAQKLGACNGGVGFGLGQLGLGMGPSSGGTSMNGNSDQAGAPSEDTWLGDSGYIHRLNKAVDSKGTTHTEMITGQRRDAPGPETYIEIKAPTTLGSRTSVPYVKVLPSYRRKAEAALNNQEIPKDQQKRVKEYFEGLGR